MSSVQGLLVPNNFDLQIAQVNGEGTVTPSSATTFTNKTITDPSNDVAATSLLNNAGAAVIDVKNGNPPVKFDALISDGGGGAVWEYPIPRQVFDTEFDVSGPPATVIELFSVDTNTLAPGVYYYAANFTVRDDTDPNNAASGAFDIRCTVVVGKTPQLQIIAENVTPYGAPTGTPGSPGWNNSGAGGPDVLRLTISYGTIASTSVGIVHHQYVSF